MSGTNSLILAVLLLITLKYSGLGQDDCIYRITATECQQEPKERVLTGFIVKGTRGIYTALHGVVDAKHIGAFSQAAQKGFSSLVISKVDIEHDVALLDSPELEDNNLPGLTFIGYSEAVNPGKLSVSGYPLGIGPIPTNDLQLRSQSLVELTTLLEDDAEEPIEERGSPFYKAKVLSIQGKFLPGHSGAPVLDSQNRVLAIANGGLRGGLVDISWAIPMNALEMDSKTTKERFIYKLQNLKPQAVFFFDPVPKVWAPPPAQPQLSRKALPVYGEFIINMQSADDSDMVLTKLILSKNATVAELEYHNTGSSDAHPTFYGPGSDYAFHIVDTNYTTISTLQQILGVESLNAPITVGADRKRHVIAKFSPISPTINRFHILEGVANAKRWIFKDITLWEEPIVSQSGIEHPKSIHWDIASFKVTVKHMLETMSDGFDSGREELDASNSDTKTRVYRGKWLPNGADQAWCQEEEIFRSGSIDYKYSYYIVYAEQTEQHAKEIFNLAKDALDDLLPEKFEPQPTSEGYTVDWKNSRSTPTHSFYLNRQPSKKPGLYDTIVDAVRETSDERRW